MVQQILAPRFDFFRVITLTVQQVCLNERDAPLGIEETFRNFTCGKLTFFGEKVSPGFRNALDAGFDRDTTSPAEQIDHFVIPQIEARLDTEFYAALTNQFKNRFIGKKDLIDEIDVFRACAYQTIQFSRDYIERPAPEGIPKIVFRAEGAMVRAAARRFHLGSGRGGRRVKTMMMMGMPADGI
jgi:hypothetical protein